MACALPYPLGVMHRGGGDVVAFDDVELWFLSARIRLVMMAMALERAARALGAEIGHGR